MSNFDKFIGSPSPLTLEGETINVYPLAIRDFILLRKKFDNEEDALKNNAELIRRCLRDNKELTIDDIICWREDIFAAILDKIFEVSETEAKKNEGAIRNIKERIVRAKQAKESGNSTDSVAS